MFDDSDAMRKAMYGQHSIHVPMWMVVQDQGPDTVAFIGGSRSKDLTYGSSLVHQLILGEVIIRPHVVVESEHLKGHGLTGLAQCGSDMDDWVRNGKVIVDPTGKLL